MITLAGLAGGLGAQEAADDGPTLTADEPIEFDEATRSMTAEGNAVLEDEGFRLGADTIRFRQGEQRAEASGDVVVNMGDVRVLAKEAAYHLPSDGNELRITAETFRLGTSPIMMSGEELSANRNSFTVTGGTVYYGEPGFLSPNVAAETLTYNEDGTVDLEKVRLRIGDVPFLPLPAYTYDTVEGDSPFRLHVKGGYRSTLGAYLQNKLLLRTGYNASVGGLLDVYSKRGVLFGPAAEYAIDTGDQQLHGEFFGGYINDHGSKGLDILGEPVPEDRYFIEWKHQHRFGERTDATARITTQSDSEAERDFRPDLFDDNQQPDNFVELSHRFDYGIASVFGRAAPNDFYPVVQRLPELRFDLMPIPLANLPVYQEGFASYANLFEKFPDGRPERDTDRLDFYYGLHYPWTPNNWLTIKPVAGARLTHYNDAVGTKSDYTRLLGQLGFDAQIDSYGYWDYENAFWKIDGLRHQFRPVLSYRWIPDAEKGRAYIPRLDENVFSTYLEPLDLGTRRDTDDLRETNTLRYGFENYLQTRDETFGTRDLAYLHLYQDFRLENQPGQNDFSEVYAVLGLLPAYWLDVSLSSRIDVEHGELEELRTQLRLIDGDQWQVNFYTDNLDGNFDQYYADARYRLTHRHSLVARTRFDAYRDQFTESAIGMVSQVGNAWRIAYEIEYRQGDTRADSIGVNIAIDLLRF